MALTYTPEQIEEKLSDYPEWQLGEDGQLHREFTFKNFGQAMLFANAVGYLAESANHHPDLTIHSYKHVKINLMTHSEGGITNRDFALIGQIDALPRRSA